MALKAHYAILYDITSVDVWRKQQTKQSEQNISSSQRHPDIYAHSRFSISPCLHMH